MVHHSTRHKATPHWQISGSSRLRMDVPTHLFTPDAHTSLTETTRELGHKQYEISNHLGNVLSVITDQKLPVEVGSLIVSYSAVVVTATDYSPFGVGLYGRSWSGEYRFGFNGQEEDGEVFNTPGTSYSAEFWQYDSRIGRRWNIDPVQKHSFSNFSVLGLSPIQNVDLKGDDWIKAKDGTYQFDKNITKDTDLTDTGSEYMGASFQNDGADYRNDGSIFFRSENKAYERMWNNSQRNKVEQAAVISKKGVLVMPEDKNTAQSSSIEDYGYKYSGEGKSLSVSKGGEILAVLGVIHTHPFQLGKDDHDSDLSNGDLSYLRKLKGIPSFTMGWDNRVFGSFKNPRNEYYEDINMSKITRDNLVSGKVSLIGWLKNYPTIQN